MRSSAHRSIPSKALGWILCSVVPLLVFLHSPTARADFTVCVMGSVLTTDSGYSIPDGPNDGDSEDYWVNGNSGLLKAIPGILIEVRWAPGSSGAEGHYADASGCAVFDGAHTSATVKVYSQTRRGGSNRLVMHNDPDTFTSHAASWSYVYSSQTLQAGNTYTYTVGAGVAKWTALFTANFTLGAWKGQLSDTKIFLGIDESCTPNNRASAHYGGGSSPSLSNSQITSGIHHLVISNCSGTLLTRQKFLVGHEVGHAIAALFYGTSTGGANGDEPHSADDYDNDWNRTPNNWSCTEPDLSDCCLSSSNSYTIFSKEWNSVAFREGYAHFLAASAWSDRNDAGEAGSSGTGQEGAFTFLWLGYAHDLERYDLGAGSGSGGRLENICCQHNPPTTDCSTSWDSAATNADWLRFLWDFYTETGCAANPGRYTMLNIYRETRKNGNLTKGNYYTRAKQAMEELYSDSCLRSSFYNWSSWNGVDHDT